MIEHILKTAPGYFQQVWSGEKTFEVRYDDRGYQKGDTVILREFDRWAACECGPGVHPGETCARYSGRTVTARIGCVVASTPNRGSQRGFNGNGYVVLSLCEPVNAEGHRPVVAHVNARPIVNVVVTQPPGGISPAAVAAQVAARQGARA